MACFSQYIEELKLSCGIRGLTSALDYLNLPPHVLLDRLMIFYACTVVLDNKKKQYMVLQKNKHEFLWYDIENGSLAGTAEIPGSPKEMEGYQCVGRLVQPCGGGGIRKGIAQQVKTGNQRSILS
ncbi:hypothetical protein ACH5RR_036886 [Cinchona calisaya]|uniref:Uncharacterized protein n=1 Tax=Cinchona calisaya TaxID=153742 RepID=A0ABD2Y4H8_9GENT